MLGLLGSGSGLDTGSVLGSGCCGCTISTSDYPRCRWNCSAAVPRAPPASCDSAPVCVPRVRVDVVCRTRAMAATQSVCFSRLPPEPGAGEAGRKRRSWRGVSRVQVRGVLVRKLFVISNKIQMGNQSACMCVC